MSHGEATRLIAVRHGETAWNVEARLQGQLDIPLNERGLEQARRTAHWLAEDGPDVVVSSDLARAQATAQAIASFNRVPLELDAGLRERSFGGFQGMTHTEVAERHAGKTVVLVAHGGVMDCLYRAATRVPLDAPRIWQLDNAAINRLLHTSSGLTMVGWNDTSHLDLNAPTLDESAARMPAAAALAARTD